MTANAAAVIAKNRNASLFRSERSFGTPSAVLEAVAHAAHGEDQLGLRRVALQLLTQMPDVHVDRARVAVSGVPPDALQQAAAAEHPSRRPRQRRQDLELHVRELDVLAADRDAPALEVHLHLARPDRRLDVLLGVDQRRAPQHSLHAAAELPDRERLGYVVVGPELEAE